MSLRETNYFSRRKRIDLIWVAHNLRPLCNAKAGALAQVRGEWVRPKTTALLVGLVY